MNNEYKFHFTIKEILIDSITEVFSFSEDLTQDSKEYHQSTSKLDMDD